MARGGAATRVAIYIVMIIRVQRAIRRRAIRNVEAAAAAGLRAAALDVVRSVPSIVAVVILVVQPRVAVSALIALPALATAAALFAVHAACTARTPVSSHVANTAAAAQLGCVAVVTWRGGWWSKGRRHLDRARALRGVAAVHVHVRE